MATLATKVWNKLDRAVNGARRARRDWEVAYRHFEETGENTEKGFRALLHLYCKTGGQWNEARQAEIARMRPPKSTPLPIAGVEGPLDAPALEKIERSLKDTGYAMLPKRLSPELVARLRDFARTAPATIPPAYDQPVVYDPAKPVAEIYRFTLATLMNNPEIQSLIMDPGLIEVARQYLGSEPVFDFPAMWWSTALLKEASSEAAQLYHFDLDRIKWLKLFVYLTDVTPETGPHRYIRGTQHAGAKPARLLKRGYARIPDHDLEPYYAKEDFVEIAGPAGTMFMGDTACWHKGAPLAKSDRLVFELQWASSLFGSVHPPLIVGQPTAAFKEFCRQNPFYSSHIQLPK